MSLEMQPKPHGTSLMDRSYLTHIFYHYCSGIPSSLPFYPSCLSFVPILQYQPTPMHIKVLVSGVKEKTRPEKQKANKGVRFHSSKPAGVYIKNYQNEST
jgi:hypothetical protein